MTGKAISLAEMKKSRSEVCWQEKTEFYLSDAALHLMEQSGGNNPKKIRLEPSLRSCTLKKECPFPKKLEREATAVESVASAHQEVVLKRSEQEGVSDLAEKPMP